MRIDNTNGTNTSALEIKSAGKGMISLTTRGHLGIESKKTTKKNNKKTNKNKQKTTNNKQNKQNKQNNKQKLVLQLVSKENRLKN